MATLTEAVILLKSKCATVDDVKTLNLFAADVCDVT